MWQDGDSFLIKSRNQMQGCQERLGNLRDNNLPYEETEKALLQWPASAD
jgi:hypothetical protein